MRGMSWFGTVCIGLGLASCQALASEEYLGEPLLKLHGQATVSDPAGGVGVRLALCFPGSTQKLGLLNTDFVPKEALKGFEGQPLLDVQQPYLTIVDVESAGEFPSDFSVSAYLPPPDSAIDRLFTGEPRSAEGSVCAVHDDHPVVADMAVPVFAATCTPAEDGPCNVSWLWVLQKSKRYFAESYACPNGQTKLEECDRETWGEERVKRDGYEGFVGNSDVSVVYLVDEAPPESYVAWYYSAAETLEPGFHLFKADDGPNFSSIGCMSSAGERAKDDVRREFAEHYIMSEIPEVGEVIDPAYQAASEELFVRQRSHYLREASCKIADYRKVSPDESLSININREIPRTINPRSPNQ